MNIPLKFIRFWIVSFSKWEFSNSLLHLPFTGFENSKATKCCLHYLFIEYRLHSTVSFIIIMIKRIISKRLLNTLVHVDNNYSQLFTQSIHSSTIFHTNY